MQWHKSRSPCSIRSRQLGVAPSPWSRKHLSWQSSSVMQEVTHVSSHLLLACFFALQPAEKIKSTKRKHKMRVLFLAILLFFQTKFYFFVFSLFYFYFFFFFFVINSYNSCTIISIDSCFCSMFSMLRVVKSRGEKKTLNYRAYKTAIILDEHLASLLYYPLMQHNKLEVLKKFRLQNIKFSEKQKKNRTKETAI